MATTAGEIGYNQCNSQAGWTIVARRWKWRDFGSACFRAVQRKVRAPQDAVVGNAHRPKFHPSSGSGANEGPGKCNRKDTAFP
jgi:hypothetical protein